MVLLHSYYSLRYGTVPPLEAVQAALDAGWGTFLFADVNNTSATWDIKRWLKKERFPGVIGVDFKNNIKTVFFALPFNEEGFKEVNEWLSFHLHEKKDFPERAPSWKHVGVSYPLEQDRDWV